GGDFRGDWLHRDPLNQEADGGIYRAVSLNAATSHKRRQFPECNCRYPNPASSLRIPDRIRGGARQAAPFTDHPHQNVGIEKNPRNDSQASGGSIGDSISPLILITPASRPIRSLFFRSGGTSLASGLPRFVISTGSRF